MPIVANSHTRAVLTNRSRAVTRRAMPCCAVKQDQKRRSTQNTTHIDGSQQEQDKSTTNKQLTFQKRRYYRRHRPWHNCIRSSRRPLVAIVPFMRATCKSHTRGTLKKPQPLPSKNNTKTLQTNNLRSRSVVKIAATDCGITACVRPACHWSPSCHSFVPHVRATRVGRQQTAAATEQQQDKNTTNKQLTIQKRC